MRDIKFRERVTDQWGKELFHYWGIIDGKYITPRNEYETSVNTSEQYTGLKDKNGKGIYEGDKGKTKDGQIGMIKWSDKMAGFYFVDDKNIIIICNNDPWFQNWLDEIEIIGNIHENKELI